MNMKASLLFDAEIVFGAKLRRVLDRLEKTLRIFAPKSSSASNQQLVAKKPIPEKLFLQFLSPSSER